MRVVALASGQGSNVGAILEAIDAGRCKAELVAVLSDRSDAPVLKHADARRVHTELHPWQGKAKRAQWSRELAHKVEAYRPDLVVLAGFMRVLDESFTQMFQGRLINIHPSLLPAFPGMHAAQQALEAGVRITGCSVHHVDELVDHGRIIAQAAVPILPTDDATSLQLRIQQAEHRLLPAVIAAWTGDNSAIDALSAAQTLYSAIALPELDRSRFNLSLSAPGPQER